MKFQTVAEKQKEERKRKRAETLAKASRRCE
jgi:hypothetical protein